MTSTQAPRKYISLFFIVIAWLIYGEVIAFCMSQGYLLELGQLAHEHFGKYIPSINRIERLTKIDVTLATGHASTMLVSTPLLFIGLLFCNVEDSIAGVRKKGKEILAFVVIVASASLVFVAGFSHRSGSRSFAEFSVLSTLLTGWLAYAYRLAFCIATKK